MAGTETAAAAEEAAPIDIDAMDDTQFAAFKAGMDKGAPEPAPVKEEAKPDASIAERTDGEQADDATNVVPHGQFHRERERRKEAERLAELSQKRLAELLEAMHPRQPEPARAQEPEAPDPDKDIFGYVRHLESEIKAIKGESALSKEQQAAQVQFQQALQFADNDYAAFAQERPEAKGAEEFLIDRERRRLAVYGLNEDQLQAEVAKRVYDEVVWCSQRGIRPAEHFYRRAIAEGYAPGAQQPAQQSQPEIVKGEVEKMMRMEETKRKATSLGGSGAPTGAQGVTPQDVIEMSEEDFAAFKRKHGDNAMAKVFGLH